MMPRGLRLGLAITDGAMLFYWAVAALVAAELVILPADMMYRGYGTPLMDAWNWSFAPIDLAFSVTGLWAVHLANRADPRWRGLAIVSLTLTACAGVMAIGFWALTHDFDLAWWLPNLMLVALPLIWLPRLIGEMR